jgi:hypothetical protein
MHRSTESYLLLMVDREKFRNLFIWYKGLKNATESISQVLPTAGGCYNFGVRRAST